MFAEGQRLLHTVRHLRFEQVYGRAVRRFRRLCPPERATPPLRVTTRNWQLYGDRRPSLIGTDQFRFLNRTYSVRSAADWNNPAWPRLWTYNLHYFDDLNAQGSATRVDNHRALMARWIAENPPPRGAGWEPYCLSLRIVNWCKWALRGNDPGTPATQSLALQTRALMQQLETHLLGNHLLANAKALVFAGVFFAGQEADVWRRRGLRYLEREVPEQVLADGGHFERSPMYHAIVLEDLLDLVQLSQLFPGCLPETTVADLQRVSQKMLEWLLLVAHPDGDISFFNDAALGIAETPAALLRYGRAALESVRMPTFAPIRHLRDSGLVRLEAGPAMMIADVGPIGPDYLPGHAHADTLSFELSMFSHRMFVNSGTSVYAPSAERLRQRGTAAHNTVMVDGVDSSEVWSSFRVARRARPGPVKAKKQGNALLLQGSHDGYRRLKGDVVHVRNWRLDATSLRVEDMLDGTTESAASYWRLHPDAVATPDGPNAFDIFLSGHTIRASFGGGVAELGFCQWLPEFGRSVRCQLISLKMPGRQAAMELSW